MDGIPVSLMEAMAMEIPTVSTDISGIPELIEDGQSGLLVKQRDAGALATAFLTLGFELLAIPFALFSCFPFPF
jgi:colanic acid/amylovoran biosynthesis glycosyltransferase